MCPVELTLTGSDGYGFIEEALALYRQCFQNKSTMRATKMVIPVEHINQFLMLCLLVCLCVMYFERA